MEYKRPQYQIVKSRLEEPRMFIQVLAGPRQVGKSTLIGQVLSDIDIPYNSYSADDEIGVTQAWITDVWEAVRGQIKLRGEREHILVIDEIQKIENWSETVKKEWDKDTREKTNIKLVILGSSRLLLKKGLTESLAGRFEMIRMGHWSFPEMHDAFDMSLDQYIYFGGYPGTAPLIKNEERWHNYIKESLIETAISKDVLMTTTIYKPALLRRLFEIGCSYSGELLSLTKLLGQLQDSGNVTTLSNYLQVLNECNMLIGLQKYAGGNARRYASIPKFQVYNNALMNAYSSDSFNTLRLDPKRWGRVVESAVGSHLLNYSDVLDYNVYYWRDGKDEVDFVIEKNHQLWAIEVKSGRRTTNEGLAKFRELFRPKMSLLVGTGGIPIEEFLTLDIRNLF